MRAVESGRPTTEWWSEEMVQLGAWTRFPLATTLWWTTMRATQSLNTSSILNLTARPLAGFVHMTKVLYATDVQVKFRIISTS